MIILKSVKFLLSCLILLAFATCAFAADAGPAVLAAPSPIGLPSVPGIPSVTGMPTIQTTPSAPTTPSVQNIPQTGVDLSGLDSTQPSTRTRTENIDLTENAQGTNNNESANADTATFQDVENDRITDEEVNSYFERILASRSEGNPMSELFPATECHFSTGRLQHMRRCSQSR